MEVKVHILTQATEKKTQSHQFSRNMSAVFGIPPHQRPIGFLDETLCVKKCYFISAKAAAQSAPCESPCGNVFITPEFRLPGSWIAADDSQLNYFPPTLVSHILNIVMRLRISQFNRRFTSEDDSFLNCWWTSESACPRILRTEYLSLA